jgi:hypothetical protein
MEVNNRFNQIKEHVEHDLYLDKNDVAFLVEMVERKNREINKFKELRKITSDANMETLIKSHRFEFALKEMNRRAFDISITKLPQWIYQTTNDALEVK